MTTDSGLAFPDILGTVPTDAGWDQGFVGGSNPPITGTGDGWGGTGTSTFPFPYPGYGIPGIDPNIPPVEGPGLFATGQVPSKCEVQLWPTGPTINFCKVLIFTVLALILLLGITGLVLPDNKQDLQPIVDAISKNPEALAA